MQFSIFKKKEEVKTNKEENENKTIIERLKRRYVKTIEDEIFKPSEIQLYNRLKFISVTASTSSPSENITRYILRSFYMYVLSILLIIFGFMMIILGFAFGFPQISLISIILLAIGTFEILKPYEFFKFFVNSDFTNLENGLYNSRFELIRIMYNNFIMYGNSLYIDERVKLNKYIYTYFTYLNYQEGVSYDKIIDSSQFFTNLEFQKFIKDIGTYIRDQNIVNFYKKKEDELKTQENAVVSEKATAFSSIVTILIFGSGIIGLLLGIGSVIQPIILQIYNYITSNFSGGMLSQISNELMLFQLIVSLPPVYYGYVILFIFSILASIITSRISKKMVIA